MRIDETKLQYLLYDNENNICGILAKTKENKNLINMIKLCCKIGKDVNLESESN